MEFKYVCTVGNYQWNFDEEKKEPWYKDLPQKKQSHVLTEKDVKDWTRPWHKEKEKDNGNKSN